MRWAAFLLLLVALGVLASPVGQPLIPAAWHPFAPFRVSDPVTPLTRWKMRTVMADADLCRAALAETVDFDVRPNREVSEVCHIRQRVVVRRIGGMRTSGIDTRCDLALRTAMWEQHGVQMAAEEHLGTQVTALNTIGSYNCRSIRGATARMSKHATAEALDVTGFRLASGGTVSLIRDWDGAPNRAAFLRAVRDSSCTWFRTTLGPDYNALHRDHFHLQSSGWGTCR